MRETLPTSVNMVNNKTTGDIRAPANTITIHMAVSVCIEYTEVIECMTDRCMMAGRAVTVTSWWSAGDDAGEGLP